MSITKWKLDPTHSELGFKIRHLMISNVSGYFSSFQVEGETQDEDFGKAKIKLKADINSIHPELLFESSRIEKVDGENFRLTGNLTLKKITHPVQLNIEYSGTTKDPWGGERAGFTVTGKIKRSDWGINFGLLETGGAMLSDEVKIHSEVQLVKQVVVEEKKQKEYVS